MALPRLQQVETILHLTWARVPKVIVKVAQTALAENIIIKVYFLNTPVLRQTVKAEHYDHI